jgi:hypothetical protein
MNMAKVTACTVTECAYNKNQQCHTMAITVGGPHPMCDTYMSSGRGGEDGVTGGVGACHVASCRFNQSLECHARGIEVGLHANHADCDTFSQR